MTIAAELLTKHRLKFEKELAVALEVREECINRLTTVSEEIRGYKDKIDQCSVELAKLKSSYAFVNVGTVIGTSHTGCSSTSSWVDNATCPKQ